MFCNVIENAYICLNFCEKVSMFKYSWQLVVLCAFLAWSRPVAWGQVSGPSGNTAASTSSFTQSAKPSFLDYFAVKTNLLEWTAVVPNISVMADLSGQPWNRSVAALTVKYRWKTQDGFLPSMILNLFELRPEYRYYLHQFYLGGYAAYDSFTILLPNKPSGWQGTAWGAGVSCGWELPLYQYKKSALDLELGISLGAHYNQHVDVVPDRENNVFLYTEEPSCGVLPYPELRAALVWRKTSVKDKYNKVNPSQALYDREWEAILINYNATTPENFRAMKKGELKVYQTSVFRDLYGGDAQAYRADFEEYLQASFVEISLSNIAHSNLDTKSKNKLRRKVANLRKEAMDNFELALQEEIAETYRSVPSRTYSK